MGTLQATDEQPARPALRRAMRGREYFTLAFGSIVGVGWMTVMGGADDDWLNRGGPVGAMLAFLLVGIALIPVAYSYGRLAERMPDAGTEVAYTSAVFSPAVSFAAGWAMTLAYVIVCPFEAVSLGMVAGYVFPELNQGELYTVGGYIVYLPHLLLGIALTALITAMNYRGIQFSAAFQNWTTFGLLAIFALFTLLGLGRGSVANIVQRAPPFAGDGTPVAGFLAVLAMLQVAPYYMNGFETVPKCSEEAAADFPPRLFLRVMLLALGVGTFFYVAVVGVVASLEPWTALTTGLPKESFATAVAFEHAFGWPWLVRLIMFGVVLSLLKVFNGNFLAATRLLYAMGRRDLLGARMGSVDEKLQTPTAAILLVGGITVGASLLGRKVLDPISEVGSLACTLGWLATCLAYVCGAAGPMRLPARLVGVLGALLSFTLAVIVVLGFGKYHCLALGGWIALGVALWLWHRTGPTTAAVPSLKEVTPTS
jgi:amino acid transporter